MLVSCSRATSSRIKANFLRKVLKDSRNLKEEVDSAVSKRGLQMEELESSPENSTTADLAGEVSCGNHVADSCTACPYGHGRYWCNGDCEWIDDSCVHTCTDLDSDCSGSSDYCESDNIVFKKWMVINCKKTCNICAQDAPGSSGGGVDPPLNIPDGGTTDPNLDPKLIYVKLKMYMDNKDFPDRRSMLTHGRKYIGAANSTLEKAGMLFRYLVRDEDFVLWDSPCLDNGSALRAFFNRFGDEFKKNPEFYYYASAKCIQGGTGYMRRDGNVCDPNLCDGQFSVGHYNDDLHTVLLHENAHNLHIPHQSSGLMKASGSIPEDYTFFDDISKANLHKYIQNGLAAGKKCFTRR